MENEQNDYETMKKMVCHVATGKEIYISNRRHESYNLFSHIENCGEKLSYSGN